MCHLVITKKYMGPNLQDNSDNSNNSRANSKKKKLCKSHKCSKNRLNWY